jgi:hypothetical protein
MKKSYILLLLIINGFLVQAQSADSSLLITLNQQIDNYVVEQNITALDKLYADDFVFSHGSGRVEGKKGWFVSVSKGSFIARTHDSVKVELHPELAVVKGKLSVHKKGKEKTDRYHLTYIRVYAYRSKQWQLVSHSTTSEYHEP